MLPASSKPPSHNVPHPSQPWGTWEWACQVRRKMGEPSNEVTIHLCVGVLAGPPPSSRSASSLPAHYTMVSATVRSNHFTANFPNLKVLQKFPAQWISGLWIIWPQAYPFAFFHDDSHFCPCLSHFPNSFRLFLCCARCLSYFSPQNHLWISFSSYSLRLLVKTGLSEMGGKATSPVYPQSPPSGASPASWGLFPSTQHIFPSMWQDGSQYALPSFMPRLRTLY